MDLAATPHIQAPIERFARWHHLKRLRQMASPGKTLNTAVRSAKQEITETGKFLAWLGADHGLTIEGLRQGHLNKYLSDTPIDDFQGAGAGFSGWSVWTSSG
jgi:hypothetical protein